MIQNNIYPISDFEKEIKTHLEHHWYDGIRIGIYRNTDSQSLCPRMKYPLGHLGLGICSLCPAGRDVIED